MIREARGDLLRADAEALVNTVNTVGVMGKGIALQFKRAYPAMFEAYYTAAKAGVIQLGKVHVWETGLMTHPRYIISFPTKGHWKSDSQLSDIEAGLADLVDVVRDLGITSVALPPLGCGNGGLAWRDVEPLIRSAFEALPNVELLLYGPKGAPTATSMPVSGDRPKMTLGRAALVDIVRRYSEQACDAPGLIEIQKLMYFLQEAGEPLRLNFRAHHYGPYADNLRHVLAAVEGHFLTGYGDGSMAVQVADSLTVLVGAGGEAASALADQADTRERIDRVLDLVDGYETPYGLELLATVHWLACQSGKATVEELVARVKSWSPRKDRRFTQPHITSALATLRDRGWIRELTSV